MSGSQTGTYHPPSIDQMERKKEEFNLLDIDFEEVRLDSHQQLSSNSNLLDFSDVYKKVHTNKEPAELPERDLLVVSGQQTSNPKDNFDEEINANSALYNEKQKAADNPEKADLEENKANIVEQPSGYSRYLIFDYYKQFFEISTEDAVIRLRNACIPFLYEGSIFENGKIDLYCPIWVIH